MTENYKILIIDDDGAFHQKIRTAFRRNFEFAGAKNIEKGLEKVSKWNPDLVLLDLVLESNNSYEEGLPNILKIKNITNNTPIVVVSNFLTVKVASLSKRFGADDFISKNDYNKTEWRETFIREIKRAYLPVKDGHLKKQIKRSKETSTNIHQFITENSILIQQKAKLQKLASYDKYHLFVTGETGTGKEVVARFYHQVGLRKNKPFVEVHFAEIQDSVMESVLFGHKKGTFTGATEDRQGLFESANGGILFLDEIGKISHETQRLLLRFLDSYQVRRIGLKSYKKLDILLITATNKNLKKEVEEGRFLEDLYHRLKKGMEIHLPPLRERREDIYPLIQHFIGKTINERFTKEVQELILSYHWKGNIRQLKSSIEKMDLEALIADKGKVDIDCLTEELRTYYKTRYDLPYVKHPSLQSKQNQELDIQTQQIVVHLQLIANGLENKKGKTNIAKQINAKWNSDNLRSLIKTYWKNNRKLVEKHPIVLEKYHPICK